jgi:hypothetical protein
MVSTRGLEDTWVIDRGGEESSEIFQWDEDVRGGIDSWMSIEACN